MADYASIILGIIGYYGIRHNAGIIELTVSIILNLGFSVWCFLDSYSFVRYFGSLQVTLHTYPVVTWNKSAASLAEV